MLRDDHEAPCLVVTVSESTPTMKPVICDNRNCRFCGWPIETDGVCDNCVCCMGLMHAGCGRRLEEARSFVCFNCLKDGDAPWGMDSEMLEDDVPVVMADVVSEMYTNNQVPDDIDDGE